MIEPSEPSEQDGADFVSRARLLESRFPSKPRIGASNSLTDEYVRFSQNLLSEFRGNDSDPAKESDRETAAVKCNFFGLLGSNGPLPLHWAEYARSRARHHNDPGFGDFINLFNHRMISLFYKAIAQSEPAICLDRPKDRAVEDILAAISGSLPSGARNRDSLSDDTKRYFAVWLGGRSRSAQGLQMLLRSQTGLFCSIDEFASRWHSLPNELRTVLCSNMRSLQLGRTTRLGRKVNTRSGNFDLVFDSIDWDQYLEFEPGGKLLQRLDDLIQNYLGDEFHWGIRLTLKSAQIKRLSLGRNQGQNHRLGFSCWLKSHGGDMPEVISVFKSRNLWVS